jgi:O-antigen ligase
MALIVLVLGFAEYLFPELFRRSLSDGLERGVMAEVHYASEYHRLQGTLAGPNAMGLFIMLALILWPIWHKSFPKVVGYLGLLAGLVALALTFSRSSFLGLVVGIIGLIVIYWSSLAKFKKWLIPFFIIGLAAGIYLTINPPSSLARPFSGDLRVQQAKRVYRERSEIGFFGRGVGSAGLVSQNRLDDGPNYYTENTYLDMYEGMGIIGVLLYLGLWIITLVSLIRSKNTEIKIIGVAGLGLAIAGIFINHYTGQAALWYFWILAGLAISAKDSNSLTDTV